MHEHMGQLQALSLGLAVLCLLAWSCTGLAETEHQFIGWLGEQHQSATQGLQVLSWDPKIFLAKGFLSDEECDQLKAQARRRLRRSDVADSITGEGKTSDIRTSSGMFFRRRENKLITTIEERLAKLVMVPVENGEGIQVLRYEKTQKYEPHHDYFSFKAGDNNGGNRLVTILMYLSTPEQGGETVFPKVAIPASQTLEAGYSECAMQGLAYKPVQGDAVVFWSINSDGRFEPKSLHGSCPVIAGEKWSATKWIHVARYAVDGEKEVRVERIRYVPPPPPAIPGCVNLHDLCEHWAEAGECETNPSYMLGKAGTPGACLRACNRCDLGPNERKQS